MEDFVKTWQVLQRDAYSISKGKGFDDYEDNPLYNPAKLALIHSEISEALEGLRHGNPSDSHIPEFLSTEAELADAVIRIMNVAEHNHWRVAEAVIAKNEYNRTRPYKHGGKAF